MDSWVRSLVTRSKIRMVVVLVGGLFIGCTSAKSLSGLPFYQNADLTPEWIQKGSKAFSQIHHIGVFSLNDQAGATLTEKDLKGKIVVANFFFTSCPGICPRTMSNMKKVQEVFQDSTDFLFLSHSVDPDRDTVEALHQYAQERKILPGNWHLLTGSKEAVYDLARESYFADKNLGSKRSEEDFLHTETFFLLDPFGRIRGVYNGTLPREVNKLMEDIRILKGEG